MNRSRVTGDLASHGNIFVDIANDRVGIGSTIPGEKLSLPDSAKIALGNSADLQLFHDSSHSSIKNITGNFSILSDTILLKNAANSESFIRCQNNGVEIYHSNSLKLGTYSGGFNLTGKLNVSGDIDIPDNSKLLIGTDDDLQIYHSGSHSFIDDTGTGNLKLRSNNFRVSNADESKLSATFQAAGAAELYHNNSKKIETTNSGVTVSGSLLASFDGNTTISILDTGHGFSASTIGISNGGRDLAITSPRDIRLKPSAGLNGIVIENGGAVELYHNNSKKFETSSTGVTITGNVDAGTGGFLLSDDGRIRIGDAQDFELYHDGSHSIINDSAGSLLVRSNIVQISTPAGSKYFKGQSGVAELYHSDSSKLATTAYGIDVTGTTGTDGLVVSGISTFANDVSISSDIMHTGDTNNRIRLGTAHQVFITNSSERLRITSVGKVGIGTDSPTEKVTILGNVLLKQDAGTDARLDINESTTTNPLRFSQTATEARIQTNASQPLNIRAQGGSGSSSHLAFWTRDDERLRITSSGSIRVGDNSSFSAHSNASNLVVGTTSGSHGMTLLTGSGTGTIFFNDGSGNDGVVQYVHSSSPNYMRIASSGHIRFDAASMSISDDNIEPTAGDMASGASFGVPRLHMRGDNSQSGAYELMARFQSGTDADNSGATIVLNHSNDRGLALQGGRGASNRSFGAIKAVDNLGRLSNCIDFLGGNGQGVNYLRFFTGESTTTTERFRITSGGAVGINETAPSAQLHVENDNANASTYYLNTDAAVLIQNKNSNASAKTVLKLEGPAGGGDCAIVYGAGAQSLIIADRQNERLRINSSGYVGINNNSPAHLLDIKNETSDGGIRLRSTGHTYHTFYFDAARTGANNHIGRFIARWSGNNTSMIAMNTGSDTTNKDNGYIAFCASEAGSSLTERFRCNGGAAGLVMQNDCYIEIPHDERCIVFDEGQKMITSNDGQGNFNIMGGKDHDGLHVSSGSGTSGVAQICLSSDGTDGRIDLAVGPRRNAGQAAYVINGLSVEYDQNGLNGLRYNKSAGGQASPTSLGGSYPVLHKGNCADGTWAQVSGDGFKVLGDGGSIAITTNDGYGNCNVCWNHKDGVPDTAGSSWRIRADIDGTSSDMHFQTNSSVSSGSAASVGSRMVLASNGNLQIDGGLTTSDQRLKKNIKTITNATTIIKGLTGKTFEWKDELELATGTKYGFIAQEVETVVPDLVDRNTGKGFDKDGNILYDSYHNKDDIVEYSKAVNDAGVIPILVESLKEAIAKIETLEAKVAALEGS